MENMIVALGSLLCDLPQIVCFASAFLFFPWSTPPAFSPLTLLRLESHLFSSVCTLTAEQMEEEQVLGQADEDWAGFVLRFVLGTHQNTCISKMAHLQLLQRSQRCYSLTSHYIQCSPFLPARQRVISLLSSLGPSSLLLPSFPLVCNLLIQSALCLSVLFSKLAHQRDTRCRLQELTDALTFAEL